MNVLTQLNELSGLIFETVKQLIWPCRCLLCGKIFDPAANSLNEFAVYFCPACSKSEIFRFQPPYCSFCGHIFERKNQENTEFNASHVCKKCLKKRPKINKVRAAFLYRGLMEQAVILFKYQSKPGLALPFEKALFEAFVIHYSNSAPDLIIPIPLHPCRLFRRGFNQAYLLIRHFSKFYQKLFRSHPPWIVNTNILKRIINTKSQTNFDIVGRKKNLKNAFNLISGGAAAIKNKHILLIDDVYTTGTTCNEAAEILLRAGALQVDVLVLARA